MWVPGSKAGPLEEQSTFLTSELTLSSLIKTIAALFFGISCSLGWPWHYKDLTDYDFELLILLPASSPSAGFRCALPISVLCDAKDPAQGLMHTRQALYQPSYYSAPGREEMSHINQDDKPQRTDRWLRTLKTTQFEAVQLLLKSWIVGLEKWLGG